jgi:ATP-dependent protease ClpP protease subunit
MKRIIMSGDVGTDITAESIRTQLEAIPSGQGVEISCNSPGGYADVSLEIHRILKEFTGYIVFKIIGICASGASYISTAADKIISTDESIYMIHESSGGGYTTADNHRQTAAVLDHYNLVLAKAYAGRSGKTLEEIQALMKVTSFYFSSEILSAGFSDSHEGTAIFEPSAKARALVNAKARFTASYHNPDVKQVGRIAAAMGNLSLKPLTKTEKEAAKLVHMSDEEYRKSMAFYE